MELVIYLVFFHEVTTEFSCSQTSRGYWLLCDEWNWSVVVLRAGESVAQVPDSASQRPSAGAFIVAVQLWRRQRLEEPTWKQKHVMRTQQVKLT